MTPAPTHFYPACTGQIVLLAMEEVLGRSGANTILDLAGLNQYTDACSSPGRERSFPFEHIGQVQLGLEHLYGPRAGRGLALQIGRVCFKYGIREFGAELGLTSLAFRLLPLPAKMKRASESLADWFNTHSDQRVRLDRDEEHIYWHIERCPLCWGRQAARAGGSVRGEEARAEANRLEAPCCHLAVGLIQEALYWLSAGRYFQVIEEKCVACGDSACTIVISQSPMG
jgi:predicted hydrocarbon binding protein